MSHTFKKNNSFRQDMVDPVAASTGLPESDKALFEPLKATKMGMANDGPSAGPKFERKDPPSPTTAAEGRYPSPGKEAAVRRRVSPSGAQSPGTKPLSPGRVGTAGTLAAVSPHINSPGFVPPVVPAMEPVIPNNHFTNPAPGPPLPWEMNYADRRAVSRDPRIQKQVLDEKQWEQTVVRGVWAQMRRFCHPHFDWQMTPETALPFFADFGVVSPHLTDKLFKIFDVRKEGEFSGLIACKLIEIGLTSAEYQDGFVKHCYDRFDRAPGSPGVSKTEFRQVKLLDPTTVVQGKKKGGAKAPAGRKGGKSAIPLTTTAGATFGMVRGFLQIFDQGTSGNSAVPTENERFVTYDEFCQQFLDPRRAEWVGSFLGPLLESCAKYFAPPMGRLPYLSVRWLKTTIPRETNTEELQDADSLLLQELERMGGVDEHAVKKKKGKKSD